MLANGITLGYKTSGGSSYTILNGLKEVPEMGEEPEKVEITCLSDTVKKYEYGIGDPGELEFKFNYENTSTSSPYRILRNAATNKSVLSFQESFPDGTIFTWDAQVSIKLGAGSVNGVLEFTCKMALQSEVTVSDPAGAQREEEVN